VTETGARRAAWVAALVFVALALPQLSRPYVGDEVEFVKVARALVQYRSHTFDRGFIDDLTETTQFQTWVFHPPLYMWLLGSAFQLFGESELVARGLGVGLGLITLALTYGIARRVAPPEHAPLAAASATLLCAVNPYFVQATLLVDIDGTVYPPLILAFSYLALRLQSARWSAYAPSLGGAFISGLSAKMTTVLALPVALALYHAARRERSRAVVDGVVIGVGGLAMFLALYWIYARLLDLPFPALFTHTARAGSGFGPVAAAGKVAIFSGPILAVLWLRELRRAPQRGLVLALGGVSVATAAVVFAGRGPLLQGLRALEGFFLITIPFCTPLVIALWYASVLQRLDSWRRGVVEPIDLVLLMALAIFVGYLGVRVRGGVFSVYHAPAFPLIAVCVAHGLAQNQSGTLDRRRVALLTSVLVAVFGYGLLVLGDAYFLTKYVLLEIRGQSLFGVIARWWGQSHASSSAVTAGFTHYDGYQSYVLGSVWYLLALFPAGMVLWLQRRRLLPFSTIEGLGMAAIGVSLAISLVQAIAPHRTSSFYGRDVRAIRDAAAYVNSHVQIDRYYLASRELAYYIHHRGYIDNTRYFGGYRGRTTPALNAQGELVLLVHDSIGLGDALPQTPIHVAVGAYPLLDAASSYRVTARFDGLNVYEFAPRRLPPR